MTTTWLKNILPRTKSAFFGEARSRGLPASVIRSLEPAAVEMSPERPGRVLGSRDLFERAALRVIVGDAGNLELAFGVVDELATAVETLGLGRQIDIPDPFRRVWAEHADQKLRGVVLSYRGGELAVVCPAGNRSLSGAGKVVHLSYRGSASNVEYDLKLVDAVRLPHAFILHLTRIEGAGAIGRFHTRYPVHIHGSLTFVDQEEPESRPCEILDISSGGVRVDTAAEIEKGRVVELVFHLGDEHHEPFRARSVVCWIGPSSADRNSYGVEFEMLPELEADRLDAFVKAAAVIS